MTDVACRVCAERFAEEDHLHLHLGRAHPEVLAAAERSAFEAAAEREDAWLGVLRRHIKAGWFVLPVFLFYVFSVLLVFQMDGNPAWPVLLTPGYVAFGALVYGMAYTRFQLKDTGRLGPGGRGAE